MAGYQIKVVMEYVKPPMWRRLAIPDQITFADLHYVLQIAFGWDNDHLHDFSFQYFDGTVGDKETVDVDYEENDLLADDFLADGWIRYTYDFGDDWRHKIVLEKELPDYGQRYPQVMKYKGNNFVEDSGGIWSDENQGEYDMAEVNAVLAEQCLCAVSDEHQTMENLTGGVTNDDDFLPEIKGISGMLGKMEQWVRFDRGENSFSELDKKLDIVMRFYQEKGRGKSGKRCKVKHTKRIMEQFLYACGEKHLGNYLKYLGETSLANHTIVNMARKVSGCMKEHPEYFGFLLDEEEMQHFLAYYHGNGMMELPDQKVLTICAMWGLWEFSIEGEDICIQFPEDIGPIIEWMKQEANPNLYTVLHRTWKQIISLLSCYGAVEMDAMHDSYVRAFGDMDLKEFRRYIYLMGRFRGDIATGMLPDGTPWVALSDEMAQSAITDQKEYGADLLQYVSFSKKQILDMQAGFGRLYPQWDEVLVQLCQMGVNEGNAIETMCRIYEMVMFGDGMEAILAELSNVLPGKAGGGEYTRLKRIIGKCWCEMGIPALKGHSRREIADERKVSAFEVASKDGFRMPEIVRGRKR